MQAGKVMEDKRVIACNYAVGISSCAKGARAYVIMIPGDGAHVEILARSRSGRWIQKWEHRKRLVHFRFVTLPPTHPRYHDSRIADYYDYLGDGVTALSLA
jgi:hypothetical protein